MQISSHDDKVTPTGNYAFISNHGNKSEPSETYMTESPLLSSPTSLKFPSTIPSAAIPASTRGLKETKIQGDSKESSTTSPANNIMDAASTDNLAESEQSGSLYRIAEQEENPFLQPGASRDRISGNNTEVGGSSVSVQLSSHSQQPSPLKPKAEQEIPIPNEETARETPSTSKRKSFIHWLKGLVPCF